MTSEELKKLFVHVTQDAQFQNWSKGEPPGMKFVYACEWPGPEMAEIVQTL